jgi:hypothetical protein
VTLIVPICYSIDTLVFAADKRVVVGGVANDTFLKIIQLGNTAVGSVCGAPRCLAPGTFAVQFDAFQLLQAFFVNRIVDQQAVDDFGNHVVQQHASFIQSHRNGLPLNYAGYLFTVLICHLDAGRVVLNDLVVDYDPNTGASFNRYSIRLADSRPCIHGDSAVRNALLNGAPIFNALWGQPRMTNLIRTNLPFNSLTRQQAIDASRTIISEAALRAAAITNALSTISQACDVVVLDQNGIAVV